MISSLLSQISFNEPFSIDLRTILGFIVAIAIYFVRKEILGSVSKEREKLKSYIDEEFDAHEKKRLDSSAQKFIRMGEIEKKIDEVESKHELEIQKLSYKIDKEISLIGQTTKTTTERLDKIEDRIERIEGKIDNQNLLLTNILNEVQRKGSEN